MSGIPSSVLDFIGTLGGVLVAAVSYSAWRARHQLGKWWRGPGADVPGIAAEAIDVLKERIDQLEHDVADLKEENKRLVAQNNLLTEMVTKSAAVEQLKGDFDQHKLAVMQSHERLHTEIGRIQQQLHIAPLAATNTGTSKDG